MRGQGLTWLLHDERMGRHRTAGRMEHTSPPSGPQPRVATPAGCPDRSLYADGLLVRALFRLLRWRKQPGPDVAADRLQPFVGDALAVVAAHVRAFVSHDEV